MSEYFVGTIGANNQTTFESLTSSEVKDDLQLNTTHSPTFGGLTVQGGSANIILKDTTDNDDHSIQFVNNLGVTDYQIRSKDPNGSGGDGFYLGSDNGTEVGIYSNGTTALTLDASQNATFAGTVTATSLIKSGGSSSEFLKADGSVDSSTYASSSALSSYLPLAGGTLTGNVTFPSPDAINFVADSDTGESHGITARRTWKKTVTAGNLQKLGKWTDTEGTVQILITVGSETGGNSGTSTYLWGGGYNSFATGYRRLRPLTDHNGHGNGADNGTNDSWHVYLRQESSFVYSLSVAVPTGANNKNLRVTCVELAGGNNFTDMSSDSALAMSGLTISNSDQFSLNNITASSVTATSLIKSGGTSSQFLKADGSVDGNTYATQSYVSTQVSNLVDSAPAALDTLNELANALGDDASFSTTISTSLGNRLRVDTASQGLSSTQKSNARTNLGLGTAATSASSAFAAASHTQAFSTITSTPTTLAGYGITDAVSSSSLSSHTSATNNPHSVTKTQVGLGNVTNESKATMFTSPSFTGDVVITDDTFPFIRSSTNGVGAGIKFSDHTTGYTQNGTLTFLHGNGSSYGSNASFTLGTTETSTTILADGKLMYGEGIYSKPATGTGAGTRKDTNWDTAYTHTSATNNPHSVTASQVGAYSSGETATLLAAKAPLASPALTGNPTAPTQSSSENSTKIATTAFVKSQGYITTDNNTFRTVTAGGNTLGSTETLAFTAGSNVTITESAGAVTITAANDNTQLSTAQVRSKISGTGLISYNSSTGVISTTANNYSLPEATATVRGGIELFSNTDQSVAANSVSATAGRTYGIQLNSAGQAVVNVPWSDTNTDTNTFRTVTAGGNTLGSGETLALTAGSNVSISEAGGQVTISSTDTNTVYSHPTHNGDDINIDTGALTGATVISDLDFNITTNSLGHVTDANGTVATRTLTAANLGISAPNAPASASAAIVGNTVEVTFAASTTSNIDAYLVYSSIDGSDYGLISIVPPDDFAASMSIIDNSFDETGTQAYRVYAVKYGILSSATTASVSYTVSSAEPTTMSVVNLNNAYYVQWNPPSSNARFVTAYNVYKHEHATQSSLSRSSASLIYSGMNTNYMYQISGTNNNNFHQFWVETTIA